MGSILSAIFGTSSDNNKWSPSGKNILITGASSGIGKTLALQYASKGANLALVARRDMSDLVVACQQAGSPNVQSFRCDLTGIGSDVQATMECAMAAFPTFDVIILNAGRSQGNYFEQIKDMDQVDYMLKLNVGSVIRCCHHLLPTVPKTCDSRIVVISSTAGILPVPFRTIYCATKHALTGFTNSLRMELQDTYQKKNCPAVCLINFPEVGGTELNASRMDFGATQEPYQFSSSIPVEEACANLRYHIAKGTREWGHPLKVSLLRPLLSIIPGPLEAMIMATVKQNQVRKEKKA